MRDLNELINTGDPGIKQIQEWIARGENECVLLPPSEDRDLVLLQTQVTTRSTMGAIVYETGGILIDGGWLRFPGSGHPRFARTLPGWNEKRAHGFYLVADDAVGGFFAINAGALGPDTKTVYYWPPDSFRWEPTGLGFTDFFVWSLSNRLAIFYESLRWPNWKDDVAQLTGARCFSFYPPLWTKEGSISKSTREQIPISEAFDLKVDLCEQLHRQTKAGEKRTGPNL